MKIKTLFLSISLALSSTAAVADTVKSMPSAQDYPNYVEGTQYKGGDIVTNDNVLYRCKPGVTEGWCSSAAWAYEPGKGSEWDQAWEKVTAEDLIPPTPPADFPQYIEGFAYQSGDIVFNQGKHYLCKPGATVPWCSGPAWAYAPGTGTAWQQAWQEVPDSELPPPVEPDFYTINAIVSGQGDITPRSVEVKAGQDFSFQITPANGHALKNITGCEGELNGSKYDVSNISENCQITAEFASNVDLAIANDNHVYASETDLLDALEQQVNAINGIHTASIEQVFSGIEQNLSWTPSRASVFVDSYHPEITFPVLMSNIDKAGTAVSRTMMTLSEKAAHRFGFVGSNVFLAGSNNDLDGVVKNSLLWLAKAQSADTPLSIIVSNVHKGHHRDIENWLKINLPEATINSYGSCDYEKMSACATEQQADLVIFGAFDTAQQGTKETDAALDQLIASKIPFLTSFAYSHAQQPMLDLVQKYGQFGYTTNYYEGAHLSNYPVSDLLNVIKQPSAEMAALSRTVEDIRTHNFDPLLTIQCQNFLVCNDEEAAEWRASDMFKATYWLRKQVMNQDLAGIDVFKTPDNRLLKIAMLLADKYRLDIDYPIFTTQIADWQKAVFADSVVSYARENNVAQPDLGDFIQDVRQLKQGETTEYPFPDTISERKTISVPYTNQWTATGWYALPGKAFTLTRHDDGEHDVEVMLNFRRSKANRIGDFKRYYAPMGISEQVYQKRRLTLKKGESVTMSTPYGGPIYLHLINGDGKLSTDVTATNVAQHPYIDDVYSPEQIQRFEQLLNETQLPQVDIKYDSYEVHLRKDRFLGGLNETHPTVEALMRAGKEEHVDVLYTLAGFRVPGKTIQETFSPEYLELCQSVFGDDCLNETFHTRTRTQHANYDQSAQCGSGCAGNPFDSGGSYLPRSWLPNHELGHGLQRKPLELYYVEEENKNNWGKYQRRTGESQNNVFALNQRWNYHYNIDKNTTPIESPYNDKDLFFAFMSDANKITNAKGERIVLNAQCKTFANPEGRDRYTASWSINKDAHYPLHIYIQMILQADKLEMPNGTVLQNGFDIFKLMHQHGRIMHEYSQDEKTWLANRDRLGFSLFDYQGPALYNGAKVNAIPGNDFLLVALNFLTERDWRPFYDLAGLRYSDLANEQAALHVKKGPMPMGMYVLGKTYPGATLSQEATFLPLDINDKTTRWPLDNSSPLDCE